MTTTTKKYVLNYPTDRNVVVFIVDDYTQQVCVQYLTSPTSSPHGTKYISRDLARAQWACYVRWGWTRRDE